MAVGLYRDPSGWAMVRYERNSMALPKDAYEEKGYKPDFDKLPTRQEWEAKLDADRA
jgi:hypothetical protein